MLAYTKFTFKEFRVCVRAIFAFAGGYKLGEPYLLGELERRHGQSADPEAWKLGYQLSTERNEQAHGRRQAYAGGGVTGRSYRLPGVQTTKSGSH